MTQPTVTLTKGGNAKAFAEGLKNISKLEVLVGIPEADATRPDISANQTDRNYDLLARAGKMKAGKRREKIVRVAGQKINNAQLMYVHTNGSPLRGIPARPVIEPAIQASGNKEHITGELSEAAKSMLDGKRDETIRHLKRAGMEGQNASRNWFVDSRNGWAPNTPETIRRKGSDRPLIDTGELRKSIVYLIKAE